jgi:hypothetical protein
VTYELDFSSKLIQGDVGEVLTILPLSEARFVEANRPLKSSTTLDPRFERSFGAYLDHFRHAGHHILSSLPDFDDDRHKREINFTAALQRVYGYQFTGMHGVELHKIVSYIQGLWLSSVLDSPSTFGNKIDFEKQEASVLAMYESAWSTSATASGLHFRVLFNVPKIEPICGSEALFYVNVDEIIFSESPDFQET